MRASRPLHAFVAVGVLAGGAGISVSCRDIIEADPVDLASELCTLLVQCDAEELDCPDRISNRVLDQTSASLLLGLDDVEDCLGDCAKARSCRDQAPICVESGSDDECGADADCCGFAGGIAACDDGRCCVPEGAACSPSRPCCEGECDGDGHCGDVVCDAPGVECVQNLECCSRLCDAELGQCIRRTCVGPDETCFADSECCDSFDLEGNPIDMICEAGEPGEPAVCVAGEAECVNCDPFTPDNCCSDQGLICYVVGNAQTVCGEPTCAPPGAECGSDGDCCDELRCDDTLLFPHCSIGAEP
jgi:hypothetical protein